jgi:hypothetical protein
VGYDLHITRAEHWPESHATPITAKEWLAIVADDPDLNIDLAAGLGKCYAVWSHPDAGPDGVWFDWQRGRIDTKWPSRAAVAKMIAIAKKLEATVQGDDGETYRTLGDYRRYFEGK